MQGQVRRRSRRLPDAPATRSAACASMCRRRKWMSRHDGRKVYFCSEGCLKKFEADPDDLSRRRGAAEPRRSAAVPAGARNTPARCTPKWSRTARRLPDLRHGARTDGRVRRRCRPQSGAGRLHPTLLDFGRRSPRRSSSSRWGRCSDCPSASGSARRVAQWLEFAAGDAGRGLGGAALLPAGRQFACAIARRTCGR